MDMNFIIEKTILIIQGVMRIRQIISGDTLKSTFASELLMAIFASIQE